MLLFIAAPVLFRIAQPVQWATLAYVILAMLALWRIIIHTGGMVHVLSKHVHHIAMALVGIMAAFATMVTVDS